MMQIIIIHLQLPVKKLTSPFASATSISYIRGITLLSEYFNLTNISYLIHRLWYDLIRLFDHLAVAYFLGHPVCERINGNGELTETENVIFYVSYGVLTKFLGMNVILAYFRNG